MTVNVDRFPVPGFEPWFYRIMLPDELAKAAAKADLKKTRSRSAIARTTRRLKSSKLRPAIALIHGFGEHSGSIPYQLAAEAFVKAGHPVFALDLPGHGRSPGTRGDITSWFDLRRGMARFLQRLREHHQADRPVMIGLSLGALITLDTAIERPLELRTAVALASPIGKVSMSPLAKYAGLALAHVLPTMSLSPGLNIPQVTRDMNIMPSYLEDPLFHQKSTPRGLQQFFVGYDRVRKELAGVPLPVLFLHGQDDQLAPMTEPELRRLAGPRQQIRFYPGARHQLLLETNRDEIHADILLWLRDLK